MVDPGDMDINGTGYIPRNLSAEVTSTAVGLFWEPPMKDVFQYRVSLLCLFYSLNLKHRTNFKFSFFKLPTITYDKLCGLSEWIKHSNKLYATL